MKRAALLLAAGLAAAVGCSNQNTGSDASTPTDASSSSSMQPSAHMNEPVGYYEYNREGKTYVTGYASSASMVREGNLSASQWVEKPNFGPDGQNQDDGKGLAEKLEKEYKSEHKK